MPVKVFMPFSVMAPTPFPVSAVRLAAPPMTPVKISLSFLMPPNVLSAPESEILLVIVCVIPGLSPEEPILPASVILPPERVMLPEALPKVMPAELTLPETVMVPAARPSVEVPKFSASEVVVVVVPDMTLTPVAEVLQPWVELFVVGAAQVPPAVPKPDVESLESQ